MNIAVLILCFAISAVFGSGLDIRAELGIIFYEKLLILFLIATLSVQFNERKAGLSLPTKIDKEVTKYFDKIKKSIEICAKIYFKF